MLCALIVPEYCLLVPLGGRKTAVQIHLMVGLIYLYLRARLLNIVTLTVACCLRWETVQKLGHATILYKFSIIENDRFNLT